MNENGNTPPGHARMFLGFYKCIHILAQALEEGCIRVQKRNLEDQFSAPARSCVFQTRQELDPAAVERAVQLACVLNSATLKHCVGLAVDCGFGGCFGTLPCVRHHATACCLRTPSGCAWKRKRHAMFRRPSEGQNGQKRTKVLSRLAEMAGEAGRWTRS
jgi:hypothetical protein